MKIIFDFREALVVARTLESIVNGEMGIGPENRGRITLSSGDSPFPPVGVDPIIIVWGPRGSGLASRASLEITVSRPDVGPGKLEG